MKSRRQALVLLGGTTLVLGRSEMSAQEKEWTYRRWVGEPLPDHDRLELVRAVPPNDAERPRAVIVLCPGHNGDGARLVASPDWQAFAQEHKVGLAGLSFASPLESLKKRRGYYQPENGSGDRLLEGIGELFAPNLPLLLSGFSGGAHFTGRFAAWRPEGVIAFALLGAGDFANCSLKKGQAPPGILGCGTRDFRFGGTEIFFSKGREAGRKWAFVSLEGARHHPVQSFEALTRHTFSAHVQKRVGDVGEGHWCDRVSGHEIDPEAYHPGLTNWLPDHASLAAWRDIRRKSDGPGRQPLQG